MTRAAKEAAAHTRTPKRTPEEARRASRDAHRPVDGGRAGLPTKYSRTPPPAPTGVRKQTHHERSLRDVTPPGGEATEAQLVTNPRKYRDLAAGFGDTPPVHEGYHPVAQGIRDRQWAAAKDYAEVMAEGEERREQERPGQKVRPQYSRGKRGAAVSGGDGISSMRDDWDARSARAKAKIEEGLAELKSFAADVEGSPVAQAAKDAAAEIAGQGHRMIEQIDGVTVLTRTADETLWDVHVDSPRPNHDAWGK